MLHASGAQDGLVNESSETGGVVRLRKVGNPVVRSKIAFLAGMLVVRVALAQTEGGEPASKFTEVRYPPLAEQARIQGDVHLRIGSGVVTVVVGHPLLVSRAVENANSLKSMLSEMNLDVTYHFVLVDTATSVQPWVNVKKGDAFERAILRRFGFKTEKTVLEYRCQEGTAPPNTVKASWPTVEIWVYGRTFCLQTESTDLLARR